jgi:hypothetical protein
MATTTTYFAELQKKIEQGPRGFPGPSGISGSGAGSASQILNALLTVDGSGSGLDADLLDGQHGSYYAPTANPAFTGTISMNAATGDRLFLYNNGATVQYGFGIQSNLLQIFCDTATDRVGIGYGTSASFTETLTVKGANVGIGNPAPAEKLDVAGNIRSTGEITAYAT